MADSAGRFLGSDSIRIRREDSSKRGIESQSGHRLLLYEESEGIPTFALRLSLSVPKAFWIERAKEAAV